MRSAFSVPRVEGQYTMKFSRDESSFFLVKSDEKLKDGAPILALSSKKQK